VAARESDKKRAFVEEVRRWVGAVYGIVD
jgi:hypothetical protein